MCSQVAHGSYFSDTATRYSAGMDAASVKASLAGVFACIFLFCEVLTKLGASCAAGVA